MYITHQLNVLSGITTLITSKIHQQIIKQFNECWVPDVENKFNFSGKLGHLKNHKLNLKYLGVLSRFKYQKLDSKYNLLVVLSGPEPQRTLLENKLLKELQNYDGTILFVRGVLNKKNKRTLPTNFKVVNYLLSSELEKAINQSELVLTRSGYSTIMDLAVLGKKAFFIPTSGQFEQEYLAKIVSEKLIAPFEIQQNFTVNNIKKATKFTGFNMSKSIINLDFFNLFNGK